MIPEKMFHSLLALGESWRIKQVEYVEKEGKVLIRDERDRGPDPVGGLMRLGAHRGQGDGLGSVGTDAQSCRHGRAAFGRYPGSLEKRANHGILGRTQ